MTLIVSNVHSVANSSTGLFVNTTSNNIVLKVNDVQYAINTTQITTGSLVVNATGVYNGGVLVSGGGGVPYQVGESIILDSTAPQPANTLVAGAAYLRSSYTTLSDMNKTFVATEPWTRVYSYIYGVVAAYGNGNLVICENSIGASYFYAYSANNGNAWATVSNTVANSVTGIGYGNGYFASYGQDFIQTSTTGATWTTRTSPLTNGNGYYSYHSYNPSDGRLYIGTGNEIVSSTNGVTWTKTAVDPVILFNSMASGNGKLVAVGPSGIVYTSNSGAAWGSNGSIQNLTSITYGNTQGFAIIDQDGNLRSSNDAVTWTSRGVPYPAQNSYPALNFFNGFYFLSLDSTALVSHDLTTWVILKDNCPTVYGNGYYYSTNNNYGWLLRSILHPHNPSTHFYLDTQYNLPPGTVEYVRYQ